MKIGWNKLYWNSGSLHGSPTEGQLNYIHSNLQRRIINIINLDRPINVNSNLLFIQTLMNLITAFWIYSSRTTCIFISINWKKLLKKIEHIVYFDTIYSKSLAFSQEIVQLKQIHIGRVRVKIKSRSWYPISIEAEFSVDRKPERYKCSIQDAFYSFSVQMKLLPYFPC